jgi:hypothetical protein
MTSQVKKIGFWAAALSAIMGCGYSFFQLLSTFGVIPYPSDLFWLFLPSLFLAPVFVVTMICLNFCAEKDFRIWTTIGWAFAAIYCTYAAMVYFSQVTIVLPAFYKGEIDESNVLFFKWKTFLYAVDCLGYFFMSLSTWFAAYAFKRSTAKWLYRWLLWNGFMFPVILAAYFIPSFIYAGALWMVTFPGAMISAAVFFRKDPA